MKSHFIATNVLKNFPKEVTWSHSWQLIQVTEDPYTCKQCIKRFYYRSNLKAQLRIHTSEKPFPSNQCLKEFSDRLNLKAQLRNHTKKSYFLATYVLKNFLIKVNWGHSWELIQMKSHFLAFNVLRNRTHGNWYGWNPISLRQMS